MGPGGVSKVEAYDDDEDRWRVLWEGRDRTATTPGWLEVSVELGTWTTKQIRVSLDTSKTPGWHEIDAVELVGELP